MGNAWSKKKICSTWESPNRIWHIQSVHNHVFFFWGRTKIYIDVVMIYIEWSHVLSCFILYAKVFNPQNQCIISIAWFLKHSFWQICNKFIVMIYQNQANFFYVPNYFCWIVCQNVKFVIFYEIMYVVKNIFWIISLTYLIDLFCVCWNFQSFVNLRQICWEWILSNWCNTNNALILRIKDFSLIISNINSI